MSGTSELDEQQQDKGEQVADKIRYGQNVCEYGVGGNTTNNAGTAIQDGYGGVAAHERDEKTTQTRREQGYGGGSGVGA